MTVGVLLMSYGSPRSLEEVAPYYTDIRGGRPPSPEALEELKSHYRKVGGRTPLEEITHRQAAALQERLDRQTPRGYRIYLGMKHWHPHIREAVGEMVAGGVERVVGIVLAPHYSKMSIGGYEDRLLKARSDLGADFEATVIPSWYAEPGFVDLVAANLRTTLGDWDPADAATAVFFTAHSLPERILAAGDPYREQLLDSSRLIAEAAGLPRWEFAFQSASQTGEPWLGPDILESLEAFGARGGRRALVAPIGFTADHLEILYDIDLECRELARELGLELRRIPSPNDDPRLIAVLAGLVLENR
ncbi:MAG: ferrochelatase [Actinomycetota bacterium]